MKIIYWLCCLFGFHDWFIHEKKQRWDLGDSNGWLVILGIATLLAFISAFVTGLLQLTSDSPPFVEFLIPLGISIILSCLWIFIGRHEFRMDARCLHCGTQKLELSRRKSAKENAEKFFKDFQDVNN